MGIDFFPCLTPVSPPAIAVHPAPPAADLSSSALAPITPRRITAGGTIAAASGFSGVLDARPIATIPAIPAKAHYLGIVRHVLTSDQGQEIRRRNKGLAVDLILAVAQCDVDAADANGRSVSTSHETAAARVRARGRVRCTAETVRVARRVLRKVGVATVVAEGRWLTRRERESLAAQTGRVYWRRASTRVLTVPRHLAAHTPISHLPPTKWVNPLSHQKDAHQRAQARDGSSRKSKYPGRTWPVAMWRLVAALDRALMPRTTAGWRRVHRGAWCWMLAEAGIDPDRVTPRELLDLADSVLAAHGQHGWCSPGTLRDPIAYMRWVLGQAADLGLITAHYAAVTARRAENDARRTARAETAERQRTEPQRRAEYAAAAVDGARAVRAILRAGTRR